MACAFFRAVDTVTSMCKTNNEQHTDPGVDICTYISMMVPKMTYKFFNHI